MKRFLPWIGLGLFAAALGGSTAACGSDSGGGGGSTNKDGGKGGTGAIIGNGGTGAGGTGAGGTGAGGGGTGGTGGTAPAKRLGRACATDAECGEGLKCQKANSGEWDGEGPAKGYCTTDCSADETVCDPFDPGNAVCLQFENGKAFCVEGCTFGPTGLTAFDPKKCHGRQEVACTALYDSSGNFTKPACLPQCNSDNDCGTGLKCNTRTGFCGTTPPTGKAVGETCVQDIDGGTNECKGVCIGLVHSGAGSGATPFTYMCAEGCTTGAAPACGWGGPGTGPAPAACLFTSTTIIENGGPGLGDQGSCGVLCNCNSECPNKDLTCSAWTGANATDLTNYFGKKGYCSDPQLEEGGVDPGLPTCSGTGGTGGGGTGGTGGGTGGSPADAGTD